MSKFKAGDRIRYTYNEKSNNGWVRSKADVVIDGEQWWRLRLEGYPADHVSVLPESGMELLDDGKDESTEDLYAQERENLIESDPIVLADEVLELRREVARLKALLKSDT